MNAPPTRSRPCPGCRQSVAADAAFAPFCSKRCQMLDLGAWLTESYRIAAAPADDGDGDSDAPPPDAEGEG